MTEHVYSEDLGRTSRNFGPQKPTWRSLWVVINGVISPLKEVISIVTLLITPFITAREPPSTHTYRGSLVDTPYINPKP